MEGNRENKNVIIGWGLAGAVLSWQLYFENRTFSVFDSLSNHTTRVAAGMVNPIVFKRLTKSWNADLLLPAAQKFYTRIEQELSVKLISHKSIYRVFASIEEENNWNSKEGDDRFSAYLTTPNKEELPDEKFVNYPFGIGKVNTFGNLDTNKFLDASKAFFLEKGLEFYDEVFDYNTINDSARFFFCEGMGVKQNPLFSDLPFKPTHGETLMIETSDLKFLHTLNRNMFLTHVEGNKYNVGATYNWELDKPITTEEGKQNLVERLAAFTNFDYKIVAHLAGIRPNVKDRRPLLGIHSTQKNAIVFNGLGAKGVMIAPYYANQLLNHVFNDDALDPEVNIERFHN
ncbi:MAG: FAD-dependent oxidoreductase [Crocinitomix sp.]|nr:FAD-dependent oxidoreductase [Crocinitomix sp.]